ncbi:C39 family peptidase, partial [Clostridium perfringens]
FGFSLLDMKRYLQTRGLPAEGYSLDIDDMRALGRPLIALVTIGGYAHFVVVKGVRSGHVLIGDPARGLMSVPDADFKKIWGGLALIVMKPPTNVTTGFNLARDWDPWSPSPIRTFQGERTITSITDNLPPIYQIETSILPYIIPVGGI